MFLSNRHAQEKMQEHAENIGSPKVSIEPAFQSRIQKAVDIVNQHNPGLLNNITDIVGHLSSGPFGRYTSNNPHTIYVNIQKIEGELRSRLSGQPEETIQKELDNQIVKTIIHEATHQHDVEERGVSSEGNAEAAEKAAENYLEPIQIMGSMLRTAYVRKMGDKWCVLSHKHKKLGCYGSKSQAVKRLRQIEYFKHH